MTEVAPPPETSEVGEGSRTWNDENDEAAVRRQQHQAAYRETDTQLEAAETAAATERSAERARAHAATSGPPANAESAPPVLHASTASGSTTLLVVSVLTEAEDDAKHADPAAATASL